MYNMYPLSHLLINISTISGLAFGGFYYPRVEFQVSVCFALQYFWQGLERHPPNPLPAKKDRFPVSCFSKGAIPRVPLLFGFFWPIF